MAKWLIACEQSGRVRDELRRRGHDAVSADVKPSARPGPHYQGDVRAILRDGWDGMIAFPPCTYLACSGLHWNERRPGRARQTADALAFVAELLDAPIERIALENPMGCISTRLRPHNQVIHPWQFGHAESKTTCLWLKNLPALKPTRILDRRGRQWDNTTASGQNKLSPSPERAAMRARTYPGIAAAMAEQWGNLPDNEPGAGTCACMFCGYSFPEICGKYGCPNCCGEPLPQGATDE